MSRNRPALEVEAAADDDGLDWIGNLPGEIVVGQLPVDRERSQELDIETQAPVDADLDAIRVVPVVCQADVIEADPGGQVGMQDPEARREEQIAGYEKGVGVTRARDRIDDLPAAHCQKSRAGPISGVAALLVLKREADGGVGTVGIVVLRAGLADAG